MSCTPGADELRIRALLLARQVGPDAAPPTPTVRPKDWLDEIIDTDLTPAPEPEAEPSEPEPATAPERVEPGRIQPWWTGRHTNLTAETETESVEADGQDRDAEPEPEKPEEPRDTAPATPAKAKKPGPPKATKKPKLPKPQPGAPRAAFDTRPPAPRQSLADAWDRVPYRLKWLTYHATAGYLGWTIGLVDWTTYVTAWIATTGLVGPQALFWYATAGATFLIYRRTRSWWQPLAWLAAVPATSTVVGVLLYAPHP